jgi:hypothetical protein
MRSGCCDVAVLCAISVLGCSSEATGPGATPDIAKNIPLYSGSIGLVVDTRDIFKRGYTPRTAEISFDGQAAFNADLTIDSLTDVAILVIQKDSLSAAQKDAFAAGIASTIVIRDANHTELGRLEDVLEVDDSNRPVSITTDLPPLSPPVVLGGPGAAYLLQREGVGDLVTRFFGGSIGGNFSAYDEEPYQNPPDPAWQQFTFTQRADSSYLVGHLAAPDSTWCAYETFQLNAYVRVLRLDRPPSASTCLGGEAYVVLEPDPDGWMRLKLKDTGEYVAWGPGGLTLGRRKTLNDPVVPNSHDQASRFRLISDDIDWTLSDQGTAFDQPIMPPAHLDFAYQGTLTNCSSATLTETVGDNIAQSTTTTFTTLESVQLFAGVSSKLGAKLTAEADIPVTGTKVLGPTVTVGAEVSSEIEFTTNLTTRRENTISKATTSTVAVSRERQLQVLPFKAVIVADYVKKIDDVVQPFTQKFRVRGAYRSNGARLSGHEIVTQLTFNFAEGVITRIGAQYVEFTIRGQTKVNQFLQAETTVQEKVNACQ